MFEANREHIASPSMVKIILWVAGVVPLVTLIFYIGYVYCKIDNQYPDPPTPSTVITPNAGWTVSKGSSTVGKCEVVDNGNGKEVRLEANMEKPGDYAEFYFDLPSQVFEGIKTNKTNGTYDLSGKTIKTTVRSDKSFNGENGKHNIVQICLKDQNWKTQDDHVNNVSGAILSPAGMPISWTVPDNTICENARGLTVKFTIGKESKTKYRGNFFLGKVVIE